MISSRQNQRVKDIRRLRRSKGDRALLEGTHLVAEALAAGLVLEEVLATPGFLDTPEGRRLARLLPGLPGLPLEVSPEILDELTDTDSPRGLLAVVLLPRSGVASLPVETDRPYLYLDGLQDPGNLGALARVAEAAGAAGLALSPGCVHPNHPRALRASAGSLLRLPVAVGVEPEALDAHLAAAHPRWAALVPRGGEDLYRAPLAGTLVLAVGAEGPGLSPALLDRAGLRLTIPMAAAVESLNATVAAALVLFEVRRRGHTAEL
ncbi:MAG TPA: RNA methyltransferase [Thermoanaerobaculia bacterium]|jgi:TrmH family RNA methyltransferase|nr:RNA methyltransferase [Thermoanaerobaculia bacterium]